MPENEPQIAYKARSMPRFFRMLARCLHCAGERAFVRSVNARTAMDKEAQEFRAHALDHTIETGHKVEITVTESFWVEEFR